MYYFVYILINKNLKRLYVGYTPRDPFARKKDHDSGVVQSTKPFRPYELIFYEAFLNKKDAFSRERYLKSGWGRRSLKKALKNYLASLDINNFDLINES